MVCPAASRGARTSAGAGFEAALRFFRLRLACAMRAILSHRFQEVSLALWVALGRRELPQRALAEPASYPAARRRRSSRDGGPAGRAPQRLLGRRKAAPVSSGRPCRRARRAQPGIDISGASFIVPQLRQGAPWHHAAGSVERSPRPRPRPRPRARIGRARRRRAHRRRCTSGWPAPASAWRRLRRQRDPSRARRRPEELFLVDRA